MEKGEPLCTVGGIADWCTTVENSMEFPKKIKNVTVVWSSDSTSEYKTQNINLKECMLPYVPCSVIYSRQDMEAARVSINRHMDEKAVVHTGWGKIGLQ